MRKFLSILAVIFTLSLSTMPLDAEAAKRMGSGKSLGMKKQAEPPKAPPAAAAPTPVSGPAAAAAPSRSWMGPVAGLAAGLGLAALASHLGFGQELASILVIGLLFFVVMMVIGFVMRKRAAVSNNLSQAPGGLQYARINPQANTNFHAGPAYRVEMPAQTGSVIGSALDSRQPRESAIPAHFDTAGFERNAKVNFIRLQAANDAGDLDDIREFTTPEMFAELKVDITERGSATQKNDVVSISAQVVAVEEESDRYQVSVRFSGVIRDQASLLEESFNEVWHLVKSRQGGGWLLAGIEQAS